jgi:hypothetical protein
VSVNVDEVIVDGFIAKLKVAWIDVPTATPVAPMVGETAVTVGGTAAETVVNVQL